METPTTLVGHFVNLYDADLAIVENPVIAPDTRWLLYDLSRCPAKPWVIAAAGRVSDEAADDHSLTFTVAGMAQTNCVVRAYIPAQPQQVLVDNQPARSEWSDTTHTVLIAFPNIPQGVSVRLSW